MSLSQVSGFRGRPTVRAAAIALLVGALLMVDVDRDALVSAQAPADAPTLAINQLDGASYPSIQAIATVLDARGVPVPGLTAAEFQAFDGTTQLAVTTAAPAQDATLGLSVVLTIDVSGSMAAALPDAKAAATAFVQSLGTNDQAALITFSDTVTPILGFTADKQQLTDAISTLSAEGGTALYEAVQTSAYVAGLSQTRRTAIVLLSDGENDTAESNATAPSALDAATGGRVPVFTVGFGVLSDDVFLRDLAARTQGDYRAASAGDVGTVYQSIAALLRSQYVLTLQAPTAADGATAQLTLIASVARVQVSATADYFRGTAPPPPVVVPTVVVAPTVTIEPIKDSSNALAIGFAVAIGAIACGMFMLGLITIIRRRRARRKQDVLVAPNPERAAAQGMPQTEGVIATAIDHGRGRLVMLDGTNDSNGIAFGAAPLTFGSSTKADIRLPAGSDVAAMHAMVWMKQGKCVLRHTGGPRRHTLVDGKRIAWVTLEDGDEFVIAQQRFRAERLASLVLSVP